MTDTFNLVEYKDELEGISPEQERYNVQIEVAIAYRILNKLGFDNGTAGHVAATDPIDQSAFWTKPAEFPASRVTAGDLVLVSDSGTVVAGTGRVNSAPGLFHNAARNPRPEVRASLHAHPTAGMAWSSLGAPLPPIVQDACAFYERHAVVHYPGVVSVEGASEDIASHLGKNHALILQNHGLFTVGHTVAEAAWWMVRLDRCCAVALLARVTGSYAEIDSDVASATRDVIGVPSHAVRSIQPLFMEVLLDHPEVAEIETRVDLYRGGS